MTNGELENYGNIELVRFINYANHQKNTKGIFADTIKAISNNISDINKYIEVLTNNIKENSINNVGNSSEVENQVNILNSIVKNLQQLTERDRMEEFMFLGLRMMEGVSMEKFEQSEKR